jgi:hypothetical protein
MSVDPLRDFVIQVALKRTVHRVGQFMSANESEAINAEAARTDPQRREARRKSVLQDVVSFQLAHGPKSLSCGFVENGSYEDLPDHDLRPHLDDLFDALRDRPLRPKSELRHLAHLGARKLMPEDRCR